MQKAFAAAFALSLSCLPACAAQSPEISDQQKPTYDLILKSGWLYDGSGKPPVRADVAIVSDRIAAIGQLEGAASKSTIDLKGAAISPGFINVLSQASESLWIDGRGMSDTKQGVTLEIFGEGWSMGPWNETMKRQEKEGQSDLKYDIVWSSLGEYMEALEARGVTPNIASFVGASTVRIHELQYDRRAPDSNELLRMQYLVRKAMQEGALGVGAALIYAPAFFADTAELKALAKASGEYGGGYIAHIRSESDQILEALDEHIAIAREANIQAEVYHLKAAGRENWPLMQKAIEKIEEARAGGLRVSANMYAYTAGATGLSAAMPPWVQEGGLDAWIERLKDPGIRAKVIAEMKAPKNNWENFYRLSGSPEQIKLIGFRNDALKPLTGKTLAEVAKLRGKSAEDTIVDLVIEDRSRVEAAYFLMSEQNLRIGLQKPWVSFGSDAESSAPEGIFLKTSTHPRAYGNFARVLGQYVREQKVLELSEAIRRMTRLPAQNWKLKERGCLDVGCYADIVVFDPNTIKDHADYDQPRQYASGVLHVWVNGTQVLKDGEHTGKKPGKVVRGPGYCAKACPALEEPKKTPPSADELACAEGKGESCMRVIARVRTRTLAASDLKRALLALEQGCAQKNIEACASMGDTYRMGHGVTMDIPKAKAFFQKACELGKGEIDACTEYAEALMLGNSDERDREGMRILERACSAKVSSACSYLGLCYTEGLHGVPYNPGSQMLGLKYYEKSCDLGRGPACTRLCSLYQAGIGGAKNPLLARQACERGCKLDHTEACDMLKKPGL